MILERIVSEGLAHYSYLIGDGRTALVIDPRRDCQVYVDLAYGAGMRIAHIVETHRNEDYVVGSVELAARTGAEIWHADAGLPYAYGCPVKDGQVWEIGDYRLVAMSTPGHTPGSTSYILREPEGFAWIAFTGDTLFAGEVGRVDLPGIDLMDELADALYDSLFTKLLPLGDKVIVCPAHGAGSLCGASIVNRPWTTLGIERQHNPKLQLADRRAFVAELAVARHRPPYFHRMEALNLEGAPLPSLPVPKPLSPAEFGKAAEEAVVLDTRTEFSYCAASVPESVFIWSSGVPGFVGWFLPHDRPILLVGETNQVEPVVRMLVRQGYDDLIGYLAGGMHDWLAAGLSCQTVRSVTVQQLCRLLDEDADAWILDVRSASELAKSRIPLAHHVPITEFPGRASEVPVDRPVYIFCGSGHRATTVASLLKRGGWTDITVVLGGMSGWSSVSCPLDSPANQRSGATRRW